jgi:hypothetical protein
LEDEVNELQYTKPEHISLKAHPQYNEQWLEQRIAEDPGILRLGELDLVERQRPQERAGRLDLLLADIEQNRRYEVELLLGPTDESHIMRTIEYWDIERRRYPAYDHVAVIVAEDITARFLNLLTLFSGTIPLVAIQLNALKIEDRIVLDFVKVIDQTALRTDRAYWEQHTTPSVIKLCDELLELVNEKTSGANQLKYNKFYIGLSDGERVNNFVAFTPRRKYLYMEARVDGLPWVERCEAAGLEASVQRNGSFRVKLDAASVKANRELIGELVQAAAD